MRFLTHFLNGELTLDPNSSNLASFPYAFAAFISLGAGILAFAWSVVLWSLFLAISGTILIFLGGAMYGFSLCDKH